MKLFPAICFIALCQTAEAQSLKVLEEKMIRGWRVSLLETPSSGLSCQAYKCIPKECKSADDKVFVRLWGSARRKAVTPMFGAIYSESGKDKGTVIFNEQSYPFEQSPKTPSKLYIAVDPDDDKRLMDEMVKNQKKVLEFRTSKGVARYRVAGLTTVLKYFKKACGI